MRGCYTMVGEVEHQREALQTGQIAGLLPTKLPQITLRHGQVMWLRTKLGYRGTVRRSAFHEYIKSLRKLGTTA
jgi:hypothetical protein